MFIRRSGRTELRTKCVYILASFQRIFSIKRKLYRPNLPVNDMMLRVRDGIKWLNTSYGRNPLGELIGN